MTITEYLNRHPEHRARYQANQPTHRYLSAADGSTPQPAAPATPATPAPATPHPVIHWDEINHYLTTNAPIITIALLTIIALLTLINTLRP